MASHQDRPAESAEHLHDPSRNSYRYLHMPDLGWINQKDPPEFDEALLQSLDQKRQELDAKVARYIAKKQGQFDDYVAEKNRRYEYRAEERRRRHGHRHQQSDEMIEVGADKKTIALCEGEDEMTRFTKRQREEDARQRAAKVSEEVSTQVEPKAKSAPHSPVSALGTVRERDSEIFQLLPGFLPLLDHQAALSSSAPVTNDRGVGPSKDPRSQLIRSCTVPAPTIHPRTAQPRRSSLKQSSNGDRTGSARKAVRLSIGPRIVTPTQSPPDDRQLSSRAESSNSAIVEASPGAENFGGKWDNEPRRMYHERIPDEELMTSGSGESPTSHEEKTAVSEMQNFPAWSTAVDQNQSKEIGALVENGAAQKALSEPVNQSPSASPLNFAKGEVVQQLADYQGRRSSISEEVKALPKDQKRKKKKKDKARVSSAPPLNPSRSTATIALTSKSPEVDVPVSRSIALAGGNPSIPNHPSSSALLSSSFADANNSGLFYPTKSRPPPSPLRPSEEDLEAVDVPLPVGGFSSGSPSPAYDSTLGYSSLGESYMALNFARRMAEKEEKMKKEEKDTRRQQQQQQQQVLREESGEETDDHLDGIKGDPIARKIQEKRKQMVESRVDKGLADQDDDGFIGELEL